MMNELDSGEVERYGPWFSFLLKKAEDKVVDGMPLRYWLMCCRDDYFDGYGYPPEAQRRSKKDDGGFLVLLGGIWHAFFG